MFNWQDKKVIVTGSEGFIGSHLTEKLVKLGAKVTAFVLYNSFNTCGWIDTFKREIKENIKIFVGDVRDEFCVRKALKDQDIIFHLAALISIPYSYYAPRSYFETNVLGTLNIIQSAREFEVMKVIHTSTSEVYGTAIYTPIDENHPIQGQSPYSASKISADKIAESFYKSFNVPVAVIRPFNTYGPRQSARAVIPTIISQALTKNEINLGNISTIRDMNYIKDTVQGFIEIAQSNKSVGEVINIGSGRGLTIREIVDTVIKLLNKNIKINLDEKRIRPEKSEVGVLICDYRKAKKLISWTPKFTLEEGLIETIRWIKNNLKYFKSEIYNI
ncbi:MAG: SDR family NAD(P)-dependent oxidoreductase [Actinobacteria bacterium]|nr:SDR family NAD(P)-dependent oxidoreductase [Chloroflexota bacterium]MBE3128909.1 SDR family NAD(P)-dependent oxidoreductase [Actinomycetota bacterium]